MTYCCVKGANIGLLIIHYINKIITASIAVKISKVRVIIHIQCLEPRHPGEGISLPLPPPSLPLPPFFWWWESRAGGGRGYGLSSYYLRLKIQFLLHFKFCKSDIWDQSYGYFSIA